MNITINLNKSNILSCSYKRSNQFRFCQVYTCIRRAKQDGQPQKNSHKMGNKGVRFKFWFNQMLYSLNVSRLQTKNYFIDLQETFTCYCRDMWAKGVFIRLISGTGIQIPGIESDCLSEYCSKKSRLIFYLQQESIAF